MARRFRSRHRRALPEVRARATRSLIYLVLSGVFVVLAALLYQGGQRLTRLSGSGLQLSDLPFALGLSFLRMLASYAACVVISMITGILAARTRLGERILIPIYDVGQSVPILGFFPALISVFVGVSSGERWGVELAAVFLIFTCQFWNMGFTVYEVIKSAPDDLIAAVRSFGVEGSLRFFRLYGPITIPRLVVTSILSWSNGWFFLVACEIIAFGPMRFNLPGIGSFLAQAAEQGNLSFVFWGLGALTLLILAMDFLLWRPLLNWSQKYHLEAAAPNPFSSSARMKSPRRKRKLSEMRKQWKRVVRSLTYPFTWAFFEICVPLLWDLPSAMIRAGYREISKRFLVPLGTIGSRLSAKSRVFGWIGVSIPAGLAVFLVLVLVRHLLAPPLPAGAASIPLAVLYSTLRVILALGLSIAWVVPVVLLVWNRPRLRSWLLTLSQVGASMPATALFPLFILLIVRQLGGGLEIATLLLLMSGMQWYILFNCLGGVAMVPSDYIDVARSLGLSRIAIWKRLVLPSIAPTLLTGAITAWGGGWNALVVVEYFIADHEVLEVFGIGSLLSRAVYDMADQKFTALCSAAIVAWVLLVDTTVWRKLYDSILVRFKVDA